MVCLVLGIKGHKDINLTLNDFIAVKEETKIKTSIKAPPAICKNASRFKMQCDCTAAVICSAWHKAGRAPELIF